MVMEEMRKHYRIALCGNPNCGKTSLFNELTGTRQHVGNYPGVTVESKSGNFTLNGLEIELVDLPGVYSLSSSSPEEEVVFQELVKPGIDLILNVMDSTILRRSMYLTTQLAELHIPMFLVFNMSDEAKEKGLKFDVPRLEQYFGSPIVQTIGSQHGGAKKLLDRLAETLHNLENHGVPMFTYGNDLDDAINAIADEIDALNIARYAHIPSRFFAIKLLEHDTCVMRIQDFAKLHGLVQEQINHLSDVHAIDTDTFMADKRYAMLAGALRDSVKVTDERRREISDKIDYVMTNKFLGLPIFLLIIYLTFWFTFTCAQPFMNWIEAGFACLKNAILTAWPEGCCSFLRELLTEGVIGGVGGVLVFLPNILFLFLAIAILEDTGYMSRAAFVMDGIMRKFGLQGRSFVPLILGFGCNVPAILATRTIESQRDRTVTIMVLPMMSCGARLPIYSLMIPTFFAIKYQATVLWLIYLIGVLCALFAAKLLKSTLFSGGGEIYLMELPPYRMPSFRSLMLHMWDRGKSYMQKAGTIILISSIILFICNNFPQKSVFSKDYDGAIAQVEEKYSSSQLREDAIAQINNERQAEAMEYTISGRIGKFLEPVFRPIGYDWKLTTANIAALSAKEIFVAQLGILYAEGDSTSENNSNSLREKLREHYTPLQGFCIMLFALLSIPCIATLAVIKRELNSWLMAFYSAAGLFCFAYLMTFIVYQLGRFLHIGTSFI